MILALMDMMLNPDLPAILAVEHIRQVRGPGAVKTIKVSIFVYVCSTYHPSPPSQARLLPSVVFVCLFFYLRRGGSGETAGFGSRVYITVA